MLRLCYVLKAYVYLWQFWFNRIGAWLAAAKTWKAFFFGGEELNPWHVTIEVRTSTMRATNPIVCSFHSCNDVSCCNTTAFLLLCIVMVIGDLHCFVIVFDLEAWSWFLTDWTALYVDSALYYDVILIYFEKNYDAIFSLVLWSI